MWARAARLIACTASADRSANGSPNRYRICERSRSPSGPTASSVCSVPYRAATWRASGRSSSSAHPPGNPTEKVRSRPPASCAASAVTSPESMPPLRNVPRGTSLTSRLRTAARSRASVSSRASDRPSLCMGRNRTRQYRSVRTPLRLRRRVWPGGSRPADRNRHRSGGTYPKARYASRAWGSMSSRRGAAASYRAGSSEAKQNRGPSARYTRGLTPRRSRARNRSSVRASHTANANMPESRSTHAGPHSSQPWTRTSVSVPLRNRWPRDMSCARRSWKL